MEDENKTDDQMLKKHIQFLEEALLDPGVRTDRESLERLLAESFIEFGSSGTVWKRKDCLGESGLSVRNFHLYDFNLESLADNVVLATYRLHDRTRGQHTLRSSIWKAADGGWQMCFHQGTVTDQNEFL
ncbi:nuclear transport factor 2 family protein [Bacillus sp. KH172YL63]|uniref:nuclear transport factor 2 family protein n=1 Tax=Bacillus sp. KH172YL63 TaxID=2709784 RepID=UPI0013E4DE9C|nr:DUF4440 domain-containing protein [Bacillus sp. KH172YL63]BCB02959.1 hypothetical protein KH172YL63_10920 [Bacillus sp. KH172YL63]